MYGQIEPDYSGAMAQLQSCNTEDLKKLLNDEDKLNDMIKELPQVRNLDVEKEMLLASNKSLAEFNLSREPRLRQGRQRLIDTYQKASELYKEVDTKKQQLDEMSRQTSLDTTLAILQTSAAETEEETESLAEKFLDNNVDVEVFLEEFLVKRKLAHQRRVKVDKLTELVYRSQNQVPSAATNNSWNPSGVGVYGDQSSFRMPMPAYPP